MCCRVVVTVVSCGASSAAANRFSLECAVKSISSVVVTGQVGQHWLVGQLVVSQSLGA